MVNTYKQTRNCLPSSLFQAVDGGRVRQFLAVFHTWSRAQILFLKNKTGVKIPLIVYKELVWA